MKTTRRLLTLLLALVLMLSLAITVSAQENEDRAPYLSVRDLWNEGEGWYESDEELRTDEDGTGALDGAWRIYYLNTWDEAAEEYVSQPVIPSENHPNLTVEKIVDLEDEYIREDEANADYFVKVTSLNSMEYQEAELYYMYDGEKVSLPFFIYERWSGFYTSQEVSADTAILNGDFRTDPLAEENVFYYIVHNDSYRVDSFDYSVVQFDGTENNDLVTVTEIENGLYQLTVDPDFVRMTTGNWQNFNLQVWLSLTHDEYGICMDRRDIWVNPSGSHDNVAARFNIDGKEYLFYEDSDIVGTWEPQFDEDKKPLVNEWGDHIHYWTKTELPTGVSYDVDTNTLTLNNAKLESLYADFHWANRDENGNVIEREDGSLDEGWNLPDPDLKINLKGSNEIVCDYGPALNLENELNVTINGTGSLLVQAVNSTENTRTEYYRDGENDVKKEVYNSFDAIHVNNGSNLTIAGNAKVTAQIEGEAYETVWDENGPTDRYENAFLSAVRVNEGNLTLKDNATLKTVLPENARDNGPAIDGMYSGGYRGVENVRNLTIQDKATLTTSSLYVGHGWQWNEKTEQDEITWTGTYNQTGGTVNITALGQYGKNMAEDDELVDHYHYSGLWTDFGELNISGGTLNVTAEPTDLEAATSAWAQAIGVGEGELNISGGTVNADVRYGQAISVPCGDATISGGTVNLSPYEGEGITVGDWEANPDDGYNPIGSLTVKGGTVNIACDTSSLGSAITIMPTARPSSLSGGTIYIENGCFDVCGEFTVSGGKLQIDAVSKAAYYVVFGPAYAEAVVTVSGGEVKINTTNCYAAMGNSGTYIQTGGTVDIHADVQEEWQNQNEENMQMPVYGISASGRTVISGGTLNVDSTMVGFIQRFYRHLELDDSGNVIVDIPETNRLVVKDEAQVNISGGMVGLLVEGAADIQGGQVNITATNEDNMAHAVWVMDSSSEDVYETEEGDQIPYTIDNQSVLNITGGNHSFTAPTTSPNGVGLYVSNCPVTIENAAVEITGHIGILEGDPDCESSTMSINCFIISRKSGETLEKLRYINEYEFEDQSYTEHIYYYAEDNEPTDGMITDINYATELLLLPDNKCGDNAYWEIKDGVLTISGEGEMYDYSWADFDLGLSTAPWMPVKQVINEVVVEEGITHVGAWSFAWLQDVTEISYPASMTSLGEASVVGCDKLAGYTVASGNKRYASPDGISIVDLTESRLHTVAVAAPGKTYTVPKGVTVIGGAAFSCCGFEEIIIPEGVTEIQVVAFDSCANLKTVTIPKSVKTVSDDVFAGCENVTVTVYCGTAGETYVKGNKLDCEIIHAYADATCTAPKTCKTCDTTEGAALGHKWSEWEADENGVKTRTCSVCKETETDDASEPSKPDVSDCTKDASCALSKYVDLNAGDWYHDGIHYCIEEGLMNGMSANTFEASGFTTRAQLVTILYRAENTPDISGLTEPFADVTENDWFYDAVVWAYNNNVVNGVSADSFAPNANVTREQVATILYRYTGSPAVSGSLAGFPDMASVSSYAETALLWATGEGLINGVMQQDGTSLLDPTGNATRAQIATILMRYQTNE